MYRNHSFPCQVIWCTWAGAWLTAADDGTLRVWTGAGEHVKHVEFSGGTAHALTTDDVNHVVLLATMDHVVHVVDIEQGSTVWR